MKKTLKAFISVCVAITLLIGSSATFIATENKGDETTSDDSFVNVFETAKKDEVKYKCAAKINDEFEDDELVVAFNHETSLEFREYKPDDFPEINVKYIETITYNEEVGKKIQKLTEEKNKIANRIISGSLKTANVRKICSDSTEITNIDGSEINKEKLYKNECKKLYEQYSVKESIVDSYNKIIILHLYEHSKQNVIDSAKKIENREDIIIAEPNFIISNCSVPNDTYYSSFTNPSNQTFSNYAAEKLQLEDAWDITTGDSSVKVGIIDTGILNTHPDLEDNVDMVLGYAFTFPRTGVLQVSPYGDGAGHGTMVSGIIGAKGNNSLGVTGVNWDVDLVSLRYIGRGAEEATDPQVHTGVVSVSIGYAENNDISILNLSFGGTHNSNLWYSSLSNYSGLAVCASGNDGANIDVYNFQPACYDLDNILSVAATNSQDALANFSNYGDTNVDLAAPGVDIYSTYKSNELYFCASGTSFSAPYVAGTAALIKSLYPTMTTDGVKKAILNSTDYVPGLYGKVATSGRLNTYKAIQSAQSHTYTIVYNPNGATGTNMANTVCTYGVPTQISNCEYNRNDEYQRFIGWTAKRSSDNKWLYYSPTTQTEGWYIEGYQPSGYSKKIFQNGDCVTDLSYSINDTISFYAQWEPFKYYVDYYFGNNTSNPFLKRDILRENQTQNLFLSHNLGYEFNGWRAYRVSDGKGYYTNGTDYIWANSNSVPDGFYEYLFPRYASIVNLTSVNEDTIRLFAQLVPNSFTLEFYSDYGQSTMEPIDLYSGFLIQLPSNEFTRTGYNFDGWILVDEYDYYYFFNGTYYEWFLMGEQPPGYQLVTFEDEDDFSSLASEDGDIQYLVAQWKILKGDVNRDGQVTNADITLIQQYLVDLVSLNSEQIDAADADEDGLVSILDIIFIQNQYGL